MPSRTLTVLVADVVSSTELFADLGVDRADTARRALFDAFGAAITEAGGVLVKTMGDGCLASFVGAADAVTAGVAMQRRVAVLRAGRIPGLSLRVGVAVGDVTEEDGDVFGPAVVAASRLCGAAGEHQVLVSDVVRMLAGDRGGHEYDAVGGLVLKGIAEPVAASAVRVAGLDDERHRLPAALTETVGEIVVGRDAETDVLVDSYKFAAAGQRRAVLVAGEPGIGKTRLVASVARRAHDDGAIVLFGRCEEDMAVAYQPFAEALRDGFSAFDADAVSAHVDAHGGEIRRLVPAIDGPEPIRADPTLEESRLFDAVTDLLRRVSASRPVVLVLDDLHWAAQSTIALLRHLLNAAADQRLCVLGTYRDTEVDRSHALGGLLADSHRLDGAQRLALRGLDGQGIEDLMSAASGDDLDDEGRALAAAVVERTAGNPFFVSQMLRHLVERGALVQSDGRWRLSRALAEVDLPEGVLDVVGRRLSRLSPAANQALAVAALCGLDFGVRVLRAVPDAGDPDSVVDGLDEAVRARLLTESGPGRFAFAHAIVRDALTRELTMAKRARIHRAIGEGLLAVYGGGAEAPLAALAMHFSEAAVLGDTATAARWATAAARAAKAQADIRGAVAVLERALAVIEEVDPVDQQARFEVAVLLSECHYALAEADTRAVESSADAAQRLGSGQQMLRVAASRWLTGAGIADPSAIGLFERALELLAVDEKPLRALAIAARAGHKALQNDPTFVADVETADTLLAETKATAPKVAAMARFWLIFACLGLPNAQERLAWCDESLERWDDPDPWWDGLSSEIDYCEPIALYRAQSMLYLGRRAEYEAARVTFGPIGEATGNSFLLAQGEIGGATSAMLDGRWDDVVEHANRMLAIIPTDPNFRLTFMSQVGRVALEKGEAAELVPLIESALDITPDHHAVRASLARFYLDSGDPARALDAILPLVEQWSGWAREWTAMLTIAETAAVLVATGEAQYARPIVDELMTYAGQLCVAGTAVVCLGAMDRYRGMLLMLLGEHDAAIAALEAALVLEESIDAPPLIARTRYWLARALLGRGAQGDPERATAELARSIATADPLDMKLLAAEGRELLATLG